MKLRIEHTTLFSYDTPIAEAYTEMRLAPIDDTGQRRASFHLSTEPRGDVLRYADRYGNDYKKTVQTVDNNSKLKIHMMGGGGWAARLTRS